MPPVQYTRSGVTIRIRREDEQMRVELGAHSLLLVPANALAQLRDWPPLAELRKPVYATDAEMERVELRIDERQWAALDWESILIEPGTAAFYRRAVVRVSTVPARVLQYPFLAPARVLEIGSPRVVNAAVSRTLNGSHAAAVIVVGAADLSAAANFVQSERWPATHILHFHGLGSLGDDLLDEGSDAAGSLGWILRVAMRWSTRLIVLDDASSYLPELRRLAQAIVDRGGPAVIVGDIAHLDQTTLYEQLLHDRPFDFMQKMLLGTALFAGAGREEALRFSVMAAQLAAAPAVIVPQPIDAVPITVTREVVDALANAIRNVADGAWATIHIARRAAEELYMGLITALGSAAGAAKAGGKGGGGDFDVDERAPFDMHSTLIGDSIRNVANAMEIDVRNERVLFGYERPERRIRFGDAIAGELLKKGLVVRPLDDEITGIGFGDHQGYVPLNTITQVVASRTLTLDDALDPAIGPRFEDLLQERADNLLHASRTFQYEDQESKGTIPVVIKADNLRNLARAARPAQTPPPVTREPRHVIGSFHAADAGGNLTELAQAGARLSPGREVYLGIRIGRLTEVIVTLGDTLLHEEKLNWTPEATGCWIEIGVTPLDFDISGACVQQVWLPRHGGMPLVTFALTPRAETIVPGVARVRFTLFARNNVVQSFVIAALLDGTHGRESSRLAEALGIGAEEVRADIGYLQRLEYDAFDPEHAERVQERTLSFVANDLAGQKVFTVKGKGFFSSTVNADVTPLVGKAREALRKPAVNRHGEYRFGPSNTATSEDLLNLLFDAAHAGWGLYNQIIPNPEARSTAEKLLGNEGVILAAHIDLRQVIPWSLIYDRKVDAGRDTYRVKGPNGTTPFPVKRAICPAGLPLADGTFHPEPCEQRADCILNGVAADGCKRDGAEYVCRDTVICPRRFWGFAHQIEVPAQQTQPGQEAPAVSEDILASGKPTLFVGHNPNTNLVQEHLEKLKSKLAKAATVSAADPADRNNILQELASIDPDIVYFFCHAWRDTIDPPNEYAPNLDFGERHQRDVVVAGDLSGPLWTHHPLVFINGCGTAAFSDSAPAGIVTQFIQGLHAAAVIGTEVTVWSELASDMAIFFLTEFLGETPAPAGLALLRARRRLLQLNNPLGLIYTLYGSAGLHLKRQVS